MGVAFDKEYSTSFKQEMLFLRDCGINYVFVKKNDYNITVWKYEKTQKLFAALAEFYEMI